MSLVFLSAAGISVNWLSKPGNAGGSWDPVWSPDGSRLAYTAERPACSPAAARISSASCRRRSASTRPAASRPSPLIS